MSHRLFHFVAGESGAWRITDIREIAGAGLATASHLSIHPGAMPDPRPDQAWCLRGITSNERYAERSEKNALLQVQPPLGRGDSTRAVLIPIRKTAAWWLLTQDERRQIFEPQSKHTEIGLRYLPAIARRLHHCRDFGEQEPFDFLTWFEFAPEDQPAFDQLLAALRASMEWNYVEREVEVRVSRAR